MNDRIWTPVALLRTAQEFLERQHIENARLNAERLLGKVLNLPRIDLYLQHDRPVTPDELAGFRELLRRRAKHEPLQYLLGEVDFFGVTIAVGLGVLIPRPETEMLTENAAMELRARDDNLALRVLDLGCGSGCVAVALAAALPRIEVDAVDRDAAALDYTRRNAEANGVGARVHCFTADLLADDFIGAVRPPYDAVISNPPYVTAREFSRLAPEVREWEPRHALVADEDGLLFFRKLAQVLPAILRPDGFAAVETGRGQAGRAAELFGSVFASVVILPDLAQTPRVVIGSKLREQLSTSSDS